MQVSELTIMLAIGLTASACSGGGGGPDPDLACGTEDILGGTEFEDLGKLAAITVFEQLGEGGQLERRARGAFLDWTDFDGDDPPAEIWDGICAGVSGLPVDGTHDPVPLTTPVVSLELDGETIQMQEAGVGRVLVPSLDPLVDGSPVGVQVEGGPGDTEFPSFEAELTMPAAPEITGLDAEGGAFVVRWRAANAGAIQVEVNIVDPPEGYQPVRCVVKDDGCLTIPSGAMLWLTHSAEPVPLDVDVTAESSTEWQGEAAIPEIGFFEVERTRSERFEP